MKLPQHRSDHALLWNQTAWSAPENLTLTAPWASDGEGTLAEKYRGRLFGANVSPELSWSPVPAGTRGLLLVCQDPDIPRDAASTHLVATLDPEVTDLPEGALTAGAAQPRPGVVLGRGSIKLGWAGPLPPKGHGVHRYVFQLFALAAPLSPTSGFRLRDVQQARVPLLGRGRLVGLFER